MNEGEQQIGPTTQAGKAIVQQPSHVRDIGRSGIGEALFDVAVAVFLRIGFGRIAGQPLDVDFGVRGEKGTGGGAFVNGCLIPNEHKALRSKAQHVAHTRDHLRAAYRTGKATLVEAAREGERRSGRHGPARVPHPLQHRPASALHPGAPEAFLKRTAKFIEKHDVDAEPPRFFLSAASPAAARRGSAPHRAHGRVAAAPAG